VEDDGKFDGVVVENSIEIEFLNFSGSFEDFRSFQWKEKLQKSFMSLEELSICYEASQKVSNISKTFQYRKQPFMESFWLLRKLSNKDKCISNLPMRSPFALKLVSVSKYRKFLQLRLRKLSNEPQTQVEGRTTIERCKRTRSVRELKIEINSTFVLFRHFGSFDCCARELICFLCLFLSQNLSFFLFRWPHLAVTL
jgi:hypothetical protein